MTTPSPEIQALAAALRDLPAEQKLRFPDALEAFAVLQAAYPAWKGHDAETRKLYVRYLCCAPRPSMFRAVRSWIENPQNEWPPPIGKLKALLEQYTPSPEALALANATAALRRAHTTPAIQACRDAQLLGLDRIDHPALLLAQLQIDHEREQQGLLPPDDPAQRERLKLLIDTLNRGP